MKRLYQHLIGCVFLLMAAAAMGSIAWGEEMSRELMVLPRQANIAVSIAYETELPDITLISPDGTAYSEAAGNVRVDHGENSVYYYLPDALAGQWLIRYDKKSNSAITADYAEYTPDLTIDTFTLKGIQAGQAELIFNAGYTKDITYHYVVSAVLLDEERNVTGRKELDQGTAMSNRDENRKISLNSLASYGKYYLELEVYCKEYGIETFDTQITDHNFEYMNENQPQAMTGVEVDIQPSSQIIIMDWTGYTVSCDSYIAACYTDENPDTPYSYQTLDRGGTSARFDLPSDTHSITVELTYLQNGAASIPYRRQVTWENGLKVSIDTQENTSSVQALISYETDRERPATVTVNGSQQQVILKGNSSFSVQLEEYGNEVSLRCGLDDMTYVTYQKAVYSDRIAPVLRLFEKADSISVEDDFFLLTGETETGCVLTVNGTEYPLGDDGTFSVNLPLNQKENTFAVISCDPAGNQTAQTLTIYHGAPSAVNACASPGQAGSDALGYLPLFAAMVTGTMAVLAVILTGSVMGKRVSLPRGVMTAVTLRNVFLVLWILLSGTAAFIWLLAQKAGQSAESLPFIRAAQRSPQEAYGILKIHTRFQRGFYILASAAGICLIAAVLFMHLTRKLKKKGSITPETENPQEASAPEVPSPEQPVTETPGQEPPGPATSSPEPPKPEDSSQEPPKSEAAFTEPPKPFIPADGSSGINPEDKSREPSNFCPYCGRILSNPNTMFCPHCGKLLHP